MKIRGTGKARPAFNPYLHISNKTTRAMLEMYERIKNEADEVVEGAETYFELRKELLKLQLVEKLSTSLSDLILIFIVLLFAVAGLFLICIAAGFIIQEILDNWALAALGALVVFALMAYFSIRFGLTRLKDSITRAIVKSVYE